MPTPDPDELWRLLNEIRFEEPGEKKVKALEQAVATADEIGDQDLINYALSGLVEAHESTRDSTRLLVPFSRLLRNFDSRPEHFDGHLTKSLHWTFKWIVAKMLEQPEAPLESIEHWLSEMRRRYAEAGYTAHAPASCEMRLAHRIGDRERVLRAVEELTASEEDDMSDCAACLHSSLAEVLLDSEEEGRAAAAMKLLEPSLDGEHSCAREPHFALALSLMPLVELGSDDRARANHLRGYTMCRGKEDMVHMIALHAEFCALTGNEARAVEILADHARLFELDLGVGDRQRLLEVAVLTCRRLGALGLSGASVPGPPGRDWTAAELHDWADAERRSITARFDRRNGGDCHSRRSDAFVSATPFDRRVHLGLKELARPARAVPSVPATVSGPDLDRAIDAAYAAFDACAADTWKHWLRVGAIAERLGIELIAEHRAEIAHSEASLTRDRDRARAHLARASELFGLAGQPGRALVAGAFAVVHRAVDEPERAGIESAKILSEAWRLRAEQLIDDRSFCTVQLLCLRAEHFASGGDRTALPPDLDERARELEESLAGLTECWASVRRCELAELRAHLADDAGAEISLLRSALEHAKAAGSDWAIARVCADLTDRIALTGEYETAFELCREGLAHLGEEPNEAVAAKLHLQSAEFHMRFGEFSATFDSALEAAVQSDAADLVVPAAIARHLMGVALIELDRRAEAVPVLEAALADLPDSELWRVCTVRFNLAESYDLLEEPRRAAEHGLAALSLLETADDEYSARLYCDTLFLTAEILEKLGDYEHSLEVYTRAVAAAERVGDLVAWTRVSRARVWLLRTVAGDDAFAEGLQTMARVAARLLEVRADADSSTAIREACRFELGETYRQHAQLTFQFLEANAGEAGLHRAEAEPVLDLQRRALAAFRDGPLMLERASLTAHQTMWLLSELGDTAGAVAVGEDALTWLSGPENAEVREGFERHLADLRGSA